MTYIDERAARHAFVRHTGAIHVPARHAPATHGTTLALVRGTAILRAGDGSLRQFQEVDGSGVYALIRRVAPNGHGVMLHYDKRRLTTVEDDNGVALTITWAGDYIESIQNRFGRTVAYGYDGRGPLTRVTDIAGRTWWYEYDDRGRLTRALYPDR